MTVFIFMINSPATAHIGPTNDSPVSGPEPADTGHHPHCPTELNRPGSDHTGHPEPPGAAAAHSDSSAPQPATDTGLWAASSIGKYRGFTTASIHSPNILYTFHQSSTGT